MIQEADVSLTKTYLRDYSTGIFIDVQSQTLGDKPVAVEAKDISDDMLERIRSGDVHCICPDCYDEHNEHIYRLTFKAESRQFNKQSNVTILFPARFVSWPNGGEHVCSLRDRLRFYNNFAARNGGTHQRIDGEDSFIFNVNIDYGETIKRVKSRQRYSLHTFNDVSRQTVSTKISTPKSKGIKTIEFFADFIAMAEEDPILMKTQQFRTPPHVYSADQIIHLGNTSLFQAVAANSKNGIEKQFMVSYFQPLPGQLWAKYRNGESLAIPGRATPINHGTTKFPVAQMLQFKNEEAYQAALDHFANQRKEGIAVGLLVCGNNFLDQKQAMEAFTAAKFGTSKSTRTKKIEGNGQEAFGFACNSQGNGANTANSTIYMYCDIATVSQFMPWAPKHAPQPENAKAPVVRAGGTQQLVLV